MHSLSYLTYAFIWVLIANSYLWLRRSNKSAVIRKFSLARDVPLLGLYLVGLSAGSFAIAPRLNSYFLFSIIFFWSAVALVVILQFSSIRWSAKTKPLKILAEILTLGVLLAFFHSTHNQILLVIPLRSNSELSDGGVLEFVDERGGVVENLSIRSKSPEKTPVDEAIEKGTEYSKAATDLKPGSAIEFYDYMYELDSKFGHEERAEILALAFVEKYVSERNVKGIESEIKRVAEDHMKRRVGKQVVGRISEVKNSGGKIVKRWFDKSYYLVRQVPTAGSALQDLGKIRGIRGSSIFGTQPYAPTLTPGPTGGYRITPSLQ